jgi:glycosyltransferase involved in cell wall biosynthesis
MTAANNHRPPPLAISVVVPVKNEADSIGLLLDLLLAQTLRPDEIVIADGGSTDRTREIIEGFIAGGAPVKLVTEQLSMPGRARNQGVRNARNHWIAFTDGGIRPERDWLEQLAAGADQAPEAAAIYGTYEPVINSFFDECAAIAYVPPAEETGSGRARPYSIVSALMRREAWERVGGFPEDLRSAEDLLFMRNVERAGFRTVRAPAAIVHWTIQPNLWRTFRRFVAYSKNNMRAGLWREWQATIFVRYAMLLASALPAIFFGWWWLMVPAGLWLAMIIARAAKSINRNRTSYPAGFGRNLARTIVLVPIIAAIDAASFLGTLDWLVRDRSGLQKSNR